MAQFEKEHFFLVNELKISQVELFSLFHFKSVVAIIYFNCFVWPYKQKIIAFSAILTFHFILEILHRCKLAIFS